MPNQNWILTDVANRVWHDSFRLAQDDVKLAGSDGWSVNKFTFRGGVSEGVDVVELNNGKLSVSIVPTRGMGLWRGACDGLDLGWKSPVALPVNPAFMNLVERDGIAFLAGFNEWLCRCGLDVNGPPGSEGTLHGRIANIPAHYVDVSISTDGPGTIWVSGLVDETMMFGPCLRLKSTVQTVAGSQRLTVIDEITNLAGVPGELELLYHTNMGRPLLENGAKFVAPIVAVVPRDRVAADGIDTFDTYGAPQAGFAEQVWYLDLASDKNGRTQTLLRNAHGDKGVSISYDKRQLPCFSLWKNTQSEADGYVTGLEPATNFPNLKGFERKQGRVISLPPGGKHTTRLDIDVHATPEGVLAVETEIAALQQGHEPRIYRQPQSKWSPFE
ncbi:MAG TPA: aldose 1-epimerase family protein [Planctomycetaceae bacterium]|nr:aldose 1-epimerase family protein [Planctomycetaceae bacterium]